MEPSPCPRCAIEPSFLQLICVGIPATTLCSSILSYSIEKMQIENICPSWYRINCSLPCRHQTLYFTREIRYLNPQSLTKGDGLLCRRKHREGSLGGHEGRPGFSTLLKSNNSSGIFQEGSVVQCVNTQIK